MSAHNPEYDPGRWSPPSGPAWHHDEAESVGYGHAWNGDDLVLTPAQQRAEQARRELLIRQRQQGVRRFGFET